MAKTTTAVPVEAIAALFKAFSWHHGKPEHYRSLQTAAFDIGKGIVTILEIIEPAYLMTSQMTRRCSTVITVRT